MQCALLESVYFLDVSDKFRLFQSIRWFTKIFKGGEINELYFPDSQIGKNSQFVEESYPFFLIYTRDYI
jgi:hypothetical protein